MAEQARSAPKVPSIAKQSDVVIGASSGQVATRGMLLNASATAMLQAGSGAMTFVLTVLLARLLGSRGYGIYALAFAWASVLTIPAVLGLDRFLVRGIAVYDVRHQWSMLKGLLLRANQVVVLSSTGLAMCGIAIGLIQLSPSLRAPFCVAMLLIPLTALTLLRQGAMQAFGRVVSGQFPEYLIRPVLIIVGVLVLEIAGAGLLTPTTALGANVAGVAVAFAVGALLLRRALPDAVRSVEPEFVTREWLRGSLPMMLVSGVWMANNYASILVVGGLQGPRAAGIYSAVQKGAEVIVLVLTATNMSLAPTIARMYARGDREGLEHATEHMARATLAASAPIAAAFMIVPGLYLGLFGPSFQSGTTALTIIALGQLVNAAAGSSGPALMMTGNERVAVRGVALGLIVNVVLGFALVPGLGVTGGAIAFASSLVLWNVVLVMLARSRVGINVTAFRRLALQSSRPALAHPNKR